MVSLDEKAAVLAQLERILGSPAFRNSRRYPGFLRHVVERTLEGRSTDLKERTLGVEVFGRPADYDSNADPIVRVTAGEVRNRIARYYHEPGREKEMRIEIPPGSYVPEFQFPSAAVEAQLIPEPAPVVVKPDGRSRLLFWVLVSGLLVVALVALWRRWAAPEPVSPFWAPFLKGGSTVTICLARAPNSDQRPKHYAAIGWPDVSAAVRVACLLEKAGARYQLRPDEDTTFEDLRRQPAVLIGAFNDVWAIRLTENLRFEPQQDGNRRWILDRTNPGSRAWSIDLSVGGAPAASRDYGVISRLNSGRSDQPVLIVAGLTGHATGIAGEFVTNASLAEVIARKAPTGWEQKNVQVVIETEVIDNHAGPARVLAVHVW